MSVQAGIWNVSGEPADRRYLEKLSTAMSQYGPDSESVHCNGAVGMVYRAFHSTRESRLQEQPCVSLAGDIVTWDGRLDNRREILELLQEDIGPDQTEVSLVACGLQKWGTGFLSRLIGDWALAWWMPQKKELILARDYVGIRRLFYHKAAHQITWSSDLTSLLTSGGSFSLDEEYVAGYLSHYPEAETTPYREIRSVPPGGYVRVNPHNVEIRKYWRFNPGYRIRYRNDADYEVHFRQIFRQAVRRRLRSDSPVLAELSGGLDSSSIVCVADDILANDSSLAPRLDTISWYDSKEPTGDERPYFTRVEQKRGKAGLHFDTAQYADGFSFHYRHLVPIPGFLPGAADAEAAWFDHLWRGGYRVILSGLGGDEFMGGLPDPRPQLADLFVQFRFRKLARALMAWSLAQRRPWIHLLFDTLSGLMPDLIAAKLLNEAKVEPWIARPFAGRRRMAVRRLGPSGDLAYWLPGRRALARTLLFKSQEMTNQAPKSLGCEEKRYPYLDQSLVEFVLAIPLDQLLRPGQRRSLMRRSLAQVVPREILSRKTKGTSARLQMSVLDAHWKELQAIFSEPLLSHFGFVDAARFQTALAATKNGGLLQMVPVMRAALLEVWLRDLASRGLIKLPAGAAFGLAESVPHSA
jgi:asparagine synthase (glutamine-hydrolysing)